MRNIFGILGLGFKSGAPAWTPAALSPGLWLKADAGVTVDGSSHVTGWADQSGNGNNMLGTGSWTVVSNWSNGKPALAGDGATLLTTASSLMTAPNALGTVLTVIDNPTFANGSTGAGSSLMRFGTSGITTVLRTLDVTGFHRIYGDQFSVNENLAVMNRTPFANPVHCEWLLNGGDGTKTVDHYIAGSFQAIGSGNQSVGAAFGSDGFELGGADGFFWTSSDHIAEIVIIPGRVISGPELTSWNNYVKTKYGLST